MLTANELKLSYITLKELFQGNYVSSNGVVNIYENYVNSDVISSIIDAFRTLFRFTICHFVG